MIMNVAMKQMARKAMTKIVSPFTRSASSSFTKIKKKNFNEKPK